MCRGEGRRGRRWRSPAQPKGKKSRPVTPLIVRGGPEGELAGEFLGLTALHFRGVATLLVARSLNKKINLK